MFICLNVSHAFVTEHVGLPTMFWTSPVLLGLEMITLKHQDLLEQSKPNEDPVRNKTKK